MGIVFAAVKPIRLVRGTRWQDQVQLVDQNTGEPVDLTGIDSLVMSVRAEIDGPVLLQLSLDEGLDVANAAQGLVDIDVSSERTLQFPENDHQRARYGFDALIGRAADEYEPAFSGKVTVLPSYTRPWAET